MNDVASKVPARVEKSEAARPSSLEAWRPLEALHQEIERIFENFQGDLWPTSMRRPFSSLRPLFERQVNRDMEPAVDIVESGEAFEVTADLPGMDEKDIEVKLSNGDLMIKGEKQQEKEEKKKDYYLHERSFGAFERRFRLPDGVDTEKIEASFNKGVLKVTLPKTAEARKAERKITVKAA